MMQSTMIKKGSCSCQLTNVVFDPSKLVNGERFCASPVELYSPNRTHGNINIMSFHIDFIDFPASTFINRKVPRWSPVVIFVSVRCMLSTPRRIWTIQLIKWLVATRGRWCSLSKWTEVLSGVVTVNLPCKLVHLGTA